MEQKLSASSPPVNESALSAARVVWATNGTWRPQPDCNAPFLVLVLYGHLRSFVYTRRKLADMAKLASRNCFFTVAVTEENICDPDPQAAGMCRAPLSAKGPALNWSAFAASPYDAAKVLGSSSEIFQDRFAAAVYERDLDYHNGAWAKLVVWSTRIVRAIRLA